jgi:hypothetical protein
MKTPLMTPTLMNMFKAKKVGNLTIHIHLLTKRSSMLSLDLEATFLLLDF